MHALFNLTSLHHEALDVSVKDGAIVVAAGCQCKEVLTSSGCLQGNVQQPAPSYGLAMPHTTLPHAWLHTLSHEEDVPCSSMRAPTVLWQGQGPLAHSRAAAAHGCTAWRSQHRPTCSQKSSSLMSPRLVCNVSACKKRKESSPRFQRSDHGKQYMDPRAALHAPWLLTIDEQPSRT